MWSVSAGTTKSEGVFTPYGVSADNGWRSSWSSLINRGGGTLCLNWVGVWSLENSWSPKSVCPTENTVLSDPAHQLSVSSADGELGISGASALIPTHLWDAAHGGRGPLPFVSLKPTILWQPSRHPLHPKHWCFLLHRSFQISFKNWILRSQSFWEICFLTQGCFCQHSCQLLFQANL